MCDDLQFYQKETLKHWILLDNQSSTNVFCNKDYVSNIVNAKHVLELATNGGTCMANKQCDVPGFRNLDVAWFAEQSITNIVGFASAKDAG